MSLCKYCNSDVSGDGDICSACRRLIDVIKKESSPVKINGFDYNDVKKNRSLACLSYLPFLFVIPLFLNPKSRYALYHAGYGFRLTVLGIVFKLTDIIIKTINHVFFKTVYNEGTAFEYSAVSNTANIIGLIFAVTFTLIYCILLICGVYCAYKCFTIKLPKMPKILKMLKMKKK